MSLSVAPLPTSGSSMRDALQEIQLLVERGVPFEQFLSRFLDLVINTSGSRGGAVWAMQAGVPQVVCRSRFEECLYDTHEAQRESIVAALADASQSVRPVIVGPSDTEGHLFEALGRRLVNLSP